jgi:hypothetical protein
MMMGGAAVPNHGEGCSKNAREGSASKRPRGRPARVGHFHDDVGPTHFAKVIMAPGLDLLPIHEGFRPYIDTLPKTIVPKANTGCNWMVRLKDVNARVAKDQGWPGFAIAYEIKIGYFLTFKVLSDNIYKVTIFDYSITEVVKKCPWHDPALLTSDMLMYVVVDYIYLF